MDETYFRMRWLDDGLDAAAVDFGNCSRRFRGDMRESVSYCSSLVSFKYSVGFK